MKKKNVLVKKIVGRAVITDNEVYTISKFARNIPHIDVNCLYEIEYDDRNFIYSMIKIEDEVERKIKGLVILDFETSGTDFRKHYPLSIGLIKTNLNLEVEAVYYSKIYAPQHECETKALEINGLKLEDGKKPEIIVAELEDIIGNWKEYRIAGWNVHFDYYFLKKLYELANKEFKNNYNLVDIQSIYSTYRMIKYGNFEIKGMRDVYYELFGTELPKHHNAIEDCFAELQILRRLKTEFS